MKKCFLFVLIFSMIFLASCGGKEISSAYITRDEEFVGGNLSFVYDEKLREIYVGGEGEFIQHYDADLSKNWTEGNRIGLKVESPSEIKNFEKATLEMNGVTFVDMFVKINGQRQNFFNIYPIVTPKTKEIVFKITWDETIEPQTYKIKIVEGTKLLDKEGKVL